MTTTVKDRWRRRLSGDSGSSTLEFVVVVPAFLLLIGFLVAAGRVSLAHGSLEQAAAAAARQASIARTAPAARANASDEATRALAQQGLQCASTRVDVDTSGFRVAPGLAAQVRATITCQLDLSDVAIPGLPGTRTITSTAVSPLDTYRDRL